jgi:type II secretory pathway pseudopilin PulG
MRPAYRKIAFSLVELLVSIAVIALLISVLLPALGQARQQGRQARCAANLRQLAATLHLYAVDYRGWAMPLAYNLPHLTGGGPAIYWWGTNGATGVDHTRGFAWPYLRSELRAGGVFECPEQPWGSYIPQGNARSLTSTYGYNGYFLCPPHTPGWNAPGWGYIGDQPWQNLDTLPHTAQVFAFGDTAADMGQDRPRNNALLDPPYLWLNHTWQSNATPTTCFRHAERSVLAAVDGHIEPRSPGRGALVSRRFRIGSVGDQNDPHYVPNWRGW